jgi:hypothetical protein
MSPHRQYAALAILAALGLVSAGCLTGSSSQTTCTSYINQYGEPAWSCLIDPPLPNACAQCTTLTTNSGGCPPTWNTTCLGTLTIPCYFAPNTVIHVCLSSPAMLAELPTGWVPTTGTWKSAASSDSGSVLATRGEALQTPDGPGHIVADAGYNVWLLFMNQGPASGAVTVRQAFDMPPDSSCAKGIYAAVLLVNGTPFEIFPTVPGQKFDFTQIPTTDPMALCVGMGAVATLKSTWGTLKAMYRR